MKSFRLLAITAMIAIGLLLGIQSTSHAFTLTLDSGALAPLTITDNLAGMDSNPTIGAITYIGAYGLWEINVTSGFSKPAIGDAGAPALDLNSFNVSKPKGGQLTIALWDSSFAPAGVFPVDFSVGGTTNATGTASFALYGDATNSEVHGGAGGDLLASLGSFSGPAFSGSGSGSIAYPDLYSLGIVSILTFGPQGGVTSFDAFASDTPVPIPPTAYLIASGLIPFIRLRKKRSIA